MIIRRYLLANNSTQLGTDPYVCVLPSPAWYHSDDNHLRCSTWQHKIKWLYSSNYICQVMSLQSGISRRHLSSRSQPLEAITLHHITCQILEFKVSPFISTFIIFLKQIPNIFTSLVIQWIANIPVLCTINTCATNSKKRDKYYVDIHCNYHSKSSKKQMYIICDYRVQANSSLTEVNKNHILCWYTL